jgi:hypothetical protein
MVSSFDKLEADFFGDMTDDTHGLWEVFEFVRLHYPELADEQVFERGRAYMTRWIDAEWIRISDAPIHPTTITSLTQAMEFLQQRGSEATRHLENSPSLDPTDEVLRVYASRATV